MKKLKTDFKCKLLSLVFALACLASVPPTFAQKQSQLNKQSNLLGFYPANYQMPGINQNIQNQFMGLGDKLCIWLKGAYENAEKFTAILTNDSTFTISISNIEMQYYPVQKSTAIFIQMPAEAILYNAYKLEIKYDEALIASISKLYLVPGIILPELTATNDQICISNRKKFNGGQMPYQYYWMEYTASGGKMLKSGYVDELNQIPDIKTGGAEATYSLMIKDANNLVLNQYISSLSKPKQLSNLVSTGQLVDIYPNPVTAELYVQLRNSTMADREINYSVSDMQGKEILQGKVSTTELNTIKVQAIPQGAYMLSLSKNANSSLLSQSKFIKF